MARSLVGLVHELVHGPSDPDPVVLEHLDGDVRARFEPARADIEAALGNPTRVFPDDADWFHEFAPDAVAGVAWLSEGRYLLLLADAEPPARTIRMCLHVLAADDVDEP